MPAITHSSRFFTAVVLTPSCTFAGFSNSTAISQPLTSPAKDSIDIAIENYVNLDTLVFDVSAAEEKGEPAEILQFGNDYNRAISEAKDSCFVDAMGNRTDPTNNPNTQLQGIDPAGWPIAERWNWCGRDRTNGGEPQNSADAVCRNHDWRLGAGTPVCECDRRFVDGLNAIKHEYSWGDRAYIEAAIQLVPRSHGC